MTIKPLIFRSFVVCHSLLAMLTGKSSLRSQGECPWMLILSSPESNRAERGYKPRNPRPAP
jgi:hypothetical protein